MTESSMLENEMKNVYLLHTLIPIGDIMNLKVVCGGVETENC